MLVMYVNKMNFLLVIQVPRGRPFYLFHIPHSRQKENASNTFYQHKGKQRLGINCCKNYRFLNASVTSLGPLGLAHHGSEEETGLENGEGDNGESNHPGWIYVSRGTKAVLVVILTIHHTRGS